MFVIFYASNFGKPRKFGDIQAELKLYTCVVGFKLITVTVSDFGLNF